MAAFGLTPEDVEGEPVDVLPDVWPVFEVFRAMATQWRTGMGGVTGLDYNCLPWVMKLHGVDDEATALTDIRVMEAAALATIHKK
ncbi:DUF1799 domain-containing protein [Serratia marcescens]|uniref:DUF1799 domain-containing protein n=1 Tax=Serratia marcescens TaxID=615 RepID=UPI000B5F956A|nr:DUF1799 domain-containing protein [Serratia marcescens]ASM31294.1 hypothetical protein BVG84_09840 [Serratia marcescens]HBC7417474.1 DUF1799 domain-containing protein [Serratia marcescens]HBC7422977.1 DUF1799 domain-containing protein [Serratia marcescens]